MKTGCYKAASESYSKAYDLKPNRPDIIYKLACAELKISKYEEAREHLEKAIKLKDVYADAYNALGMCFAKLD